VAVDLATPLSQRDIALRTATVYRTAEQRKLSPTLAARLREKAVDGVVLMSPRTARIFAHLTIGAHLMAEAQRCIHFCISPNTAAALDELAPPHRRVAASPDLPSLLALINREKAQLPGRA
jgi:uroporphyrinogen-III synthase